MRTKIIRIIETRLILAIGVLATLSACADAPSGIERSAPDVGLSVSAGSEPITNRYVVLFDKDLPDVAAASDQLIGRFGGVRFHRYDSAVKGFAVANLPAGAVEALRRHPLVRSIEEDVEIDQNDVQVLPYNGSSHQTSLLWSLDRVDERAAAFDGEFEYERDGSGVHIYIVDTGIRCGHQEFAGRMGSGVTFLSFSSGASPCVDQDGHGTEVAGVAAASTYGVAKGAMLHPVRINDNGGAYASDIVAGLDWIAAHAVHPAVANLSYGSVPGSFAVRDAIEGVASAGVAITKSAGNVNGDAFDDRGNRAVGAIVVGASTWYDYRASFSSYGSLLSVFAPGSQIFTTSNASNSATTTVSGTSFAAPLAAGVAAAYLEEYPNTTAYQVRNFLKDSATAGVLSAIGTGSPNRLLYSRIPPTPPPPTPISVGISGPEEIEPGATCTWYAQVTTGTAPYTYSWKSNGAVVGSAYSYTGSKPIGSGGTTFTLRLIVDDSANGHGEYQITVAEILGAGLCPI